MKRTHATRARRWDALILLLLAGWTLAQLASPQLTTPVAAQGRADPWDVRWLPGDRRGRRALDQALDALLQGTGLRGQGATIRENAERHAVNPAFALAMFRQEAGFARRGTRAHSNKNPANIVATGDCWDQPAGARCEGIYGEVGTDGRFGRYASMADGIEAFFLLMAREYAGLPLDDLIRRACPPVECDVPAYVARMEQWTVEYQAQLIAAIYDPPAPPGALVDDRSPQFWRRGPSEYWHQAAGGYAEHLWWTHNNEQDAENAARWMLELEGPGTYALYVYIPPLHATTRQAHYTITCAGQAHSVTVDQRAHPNEWVSLGQVRCAGTGGEYVELSDETGEAPLEYEIAFDAIAHQRVDGQAPATVTPLPSTPPATADMTRGPDTTSPPRGTERPVLLERLWKTTQTLVPFCCGGGVLFLVLGMLAIVYRDRLPFFPRR